MADLSAILSRLEAVTSRLEAAAGGAGAAPSAAAAAAPSADSGDVKPILAAFDEIMEGDFQKFVDFSSQLGGDINEAAAHVAGAFKAQREFLRIASVSKKPSGADLQKLLTPTVEALQKTQKFREDNRRSKNFNHLSTMSEGIPILGWVQVSPKPAPYCGEMVGAAEFYSNRVIKEYKGKEESESHLAWARSFIATCKALQAFVKKHHTTGLVWNAQGGEAMAAAGSAPAPAAAAAPAGGAPPPPGPPPPAMTAAEIDAAVAGANKSAAAKPDTSGLMAALNKGGDVTKGLKKVDRSQMTHKNPELRASSVVKAEPKKETKAAPKYGGAVKKGTPKVELSGKKWMIEWQEDNANIEIEGDRSQTVYIYKCTRSTIKINGKVNAITVDGCKKTGLVFGDLVATCDLVNCQSVQVQTTGKVPTISVDKTDGCQIYLSKDAMDCEIISAKSSEMNVSHPGATEDDDWVETPLPEQYKSFQKDGKWVTECMQHE